jgi:hypothetical protein
MTVQRFAQQIEYLLWTGAIEGEQILNLHYLLLSYGHQWISDQEIQKAIDECNPDQIEDIWDKQLPSMPE